ncbi:MAG: ABC transporter ATP-binding protein [Acidimicrobiia bacterium]|nr:ABC transporter ATP-binding protein [Acidimicrobiia bacterium]MYH06280.1 ABC transporter ATP-binding protein [Acidimicrobiia bacterium]MYK56043.1 ABC transporter ATP-binding protein [Acidimicrobiia bacterium]
MTFELELRGITKRYPGVLANDAVDLAVRPAEIHAIVGENGAGKTTLMSLLYGLFPPDEGDIFIRGERVEFSSALDAIAAGLGMVHQSFKLFPTLSVAENVVFRQEPRRRGLIDRVAAVARVRDLADRYGLAVDPEAAVEDLPVGVLQRVEILKALYRDAQVLILDEPTAVLTPQERDQLFEVIRRLRDAGRTVIFITHKLGEVMAISDRVTVLRNGRAVADLVTAETDPAEITLHMTGRALGLDRRAPEHQPDQAVLEVENLTVLGGHGRAVVKDAGFQVRSGEIVGIAGVAGNGQSELIEALCGLTEADTGAVMLSGRDITTADVAGRRAAGLAYIPEDRYGVGTIRRASVSENLLIGHHREETVQRRGWFDRGAVARLTRRLVEVFDIKTGSVSGPVSTLSGGNLQKVVVAREMEHRTPLLIAEQPTRGLDIGAIEFVHSQLIRYRDQGGAVLMVSAELSEILALSTRILVMFEGSIVATLDPRTVDEPEVGLYMTGAHLEAAVA